MNNIIYEGWEIFDENPEPGERFMIWRGEFEKPVVTRDICFLEEARLIERAPHLLDLCKGLVQAWDTGAIILWTDEDIELFRNEIKKVEGNNNE